MGKIVQRLPVKLFTGLIFQDSAIFEQAKAVLARHFGRIDLQSSILPFIHTDYYEKEFGTGLKRAFVSFARLIPAEELSRIKVKTNQIERKFCRAESRRINIDPGYLDLGKLVLASTKDHGHRIYLGRGIYAEVTLFFQDKTFQPWPWTYPDYKTAGYIAVLNQMRACYAGQIKTRSR
ncbi:MAG TPA: DUF4416 family protein [Patescibacteria group bacterium]|nr:DUF4416 family protein [Patescibacteria group bacterium]